MAAKPKLSAYEELAELVRANLPSTLNVAQACEEALQPSLEWIGHYLSIEKSVEAKRLLEASYSAGVEAVSLVAFGIARAAVFSCRGHYEFYLMYLYYKDHPVELNAALSYRDSLKLPGELKKYFRTYSQSYEMRWKELTKTRKKNGEDDVYDVLSGVVHGGALESLPAASSPIEVTANIDILKQFPELMEGVAEYLSDTSVATYETNWMSLPEKIRGRLVKRFGKYSAQDALFK
jgi:hypothetical protein